MQLRYNYRLDPWPRHRAAFGKAFGCARVVFNDALRARDAAHQAGEPYLTDAELSARLTAVKTTPERAWLGEVSAVVLQQALADLNVAYRNFFASVADRRKGPKVALPRFRSRKDRKQAIRQRLRVLQNMPEYVRNQRLNYPNFTRGMSEEDRSTLRDLSHLHVGGAMEPPNE